MSHTILFSDWLKLIPFFVIKRAGEKFWHFALCSSQGKNYKSMANALKSAVWAYFEILENDNSKAICKVCQEKGCRIIISRGGKTCKQFTTTNLRNHLRKHPKEFLAMSADEKERNEEKGKRMQQEMDSNTVTMHEKKTKNSDVIATKF
jgi:hypothetical protein